MKMQQKIVLSICLLYNVILGIGQNRTPLSMPKPEGVNASDGIYPDKIKISWNDMGSGVEYQVERKGTGLISKWIPSTFIADYDKNIKPGQKYFYSVRARKGSQISELSNEDSGYVLNVATPTPKNNLLLSIETLEKQTTPPSDSLVVNYIVENKTIEKMTDLMLRFYLSKDKIYNRSEDILIDSIKLDILEAQIKKSGTIKLKIKGNLPESTYYILLVNDKYGLSTTWKEIIIK